MGSKRRGPTIVSMQGLALAAPHMPIPEAVITAIPTKMKSVGEDMKPLSNQAR